MYTYAYEISPGNIRHNIMGMSWFPRHITPVKPTLQPGLRQMQAFAPIGYEMLAPRMPFTLLPYRPAVTDQRFGPVRSYTDPETATQTKNRPWWMQAPPGGPPSRSSTPSPWTPPGPRTKEKKARLGPAAMRAVNEAWGATEAADLIDALFDALPEDIQKTVNKSGRVSQSGWNPGLAFATPIDKGRHVFLNMDKLDIPEAIGNIIKNHFTDAVLGKIFGGAGKALTKQGITHGGLF